MNNLTTGQINNNTDIVIYGKPICNFCLILKDVFDILNITYKYVSIENNSKYSFKKIPAIEYAGTIFDNYNSLNEIFSICNTKYTIENLYDKLTEQIYSLDETDTDQIIIILSLLKVYEIRYFHKKGYLLAHHIIMADNNDLLKKFIQDNLGKIDDLLTKNHIFNTNGVKIMVPENQSILHVSVSKPDIYLKLKNVIEDTPDILGFYAKDYYENRNDVNFLTKINNLMIKNYGVCWNIDNFIVDKYHNNTIKNEILEHINKTNKIKPNSMHKYGNNLTNLECIKNLVQNISKTFNLDLENKIYDIYAFTAEYGPNTNNNLDLHKDNSLITINWNLEIDENLEGTEVIFPTIKKEIKMEESMINIHHGKIDHYVKPLKTGSRLNLIIWIK